MYFVLDLISVKISVVIDIITDLHDSLNNMIQMVNPNTISHSPCVLCQIFKEGFKESLIGELRLSS